MTPRARTDKARDVKGVTCPASRHVQEIAERQIHEAESMLAVCAALWEARAELARLKGIA